MTTTNAIRKIVKIDEERCNGCGSCIPKCAEGALQIIDGKARLISEKYCDGLGACLGECPQDAIIIEERPAEEFDEEATKLHLEERRLEEKLPCGCASATVTQFEKPVSKKTNLAGNAPQPSMLGHWPVQLTLVPPSAPFLQNADLILAADCVPFAYAGFHRDFLEGHSVLVACPKLDDFQSHLQKLTDILRQSSVKSITVVRMEVPCCNGLNYMVKQAMQLAGKEVPLREAVISIKGDPVQQGSVN